MSTFSVRLHFCFQALNAYEIVCVGLTIINLLSIRLLPVSDSEYMAAWYLTQRSEQLLDHVLSVTLQRAPVILTQLILLSGWKTSSTQHLLRELSSTSEV